MTEQTSDYAAEIEAYLDGRATFPAAGDQIAEVKNGGSPWARLTVTGLRAVLDENKKLRRRLDVAQGHLGSARTLAASLQRLTDYPTTADAYGAHLAATLRFTAGQLVRALNGGPVPPAVETAEHLRQRIAADCARRASYYDHPEIWRPDSREPDAIAARAMQQAWATAARLIRAGEIPAELVLAGSSDVETGDPTDVGVFERLTGAPGDDAHMPQGGQQRHAGGADGGSATTETLLSPEGLTDAPAIARRPPLPMPGCGHTAQWMIPTETGVVCMVCGPQDAESGPPACPDCGLPETNCACG